MPSRAPDREHAGAADAGDEDAVGAIDAGKLRLGQGGQSSAPSAAPCRVRTRPPSTVTKLGQNPFMHE